MDEVERLIKRLKDTDSVVRADAAEALGKIGKPAVPALIEALKDEDSNMRLWAAITLSSIGQPAIPALIEALEDTNFFVRSNAARALGGILNKCETIEAVNEFETHLQDGMNSVRKQWKKGVTTEFGLQISKLQIAAARKRDELAPKRDILLDEVPKPPKKGEIYQQMRGTVRNG